MDPENRAIQHIVETAKVPSFSSYEERLHPYIKSIFYAVAGAESIEVEGNNLVYRLEGTGDRTIALTAHLDKINHYGANHPDSLPVQQTETYIEGAMDDCAGLGIILAVAEAGRSHSFPNLLFFFSEMEEKKGLKDYPELLKKGGKGYKSGMGAQRISRHCLDFDIIPDEIITVDTTPLFKGEKGIALYSDHWELNDIDASSALKQQTENMKKRFKAIHPDIKFDNNTNDYLHYGEIFNQSGEYTVPSVALEPAIFPYHQKGERVFIDDIKQVLQILASYLTKTA
jgi:hypothetical protein